MSKLQLTLGSAVRTGLGEPNMEDDAGAMACRPALKTGSRRRVGWGSIPPSSTMYSCQSAANLVLFGQVFSDREGGPAAPSESFTRLAQLVEQQTDNLLVAGSNPAPSTKINKFLE